MRRFMRRLLHGQRDDALCDGGIELRDARGSRLVVQKPFEALGGEASRQRQTQVLDLPVSRIIAFVPSPSALSNMICPRHTCFWGALRVFDQNVKPIQVGRGHGKGAAGSHAANSHAPSPSR
jgi:hypothetical protein